jgi:uncharacterized membrane protein
MSAELTVVNDLAAKLIRLVNDEAGDNIDLTTGLILMGLVRALGSVVGSIQCPHCRSVAVRALTKDLPRAMTRELKHANADDNAMPFPGHLH